MIKITIVWWRANWIDTINEKNPGGLSNTKGMENINDIRFQRGDVDVLISLFLWRMKNNMMLGRGRRMEMQC